MIIMYRRYNIIYAEPNNPQYKGGSKMNMNIEEYCEYLKKSLESAVNKKDEEVIFEGESGKINLSKIEEHNPGLLQETLDLLG